MAFNIADLFERAVDTFPDRLAMAVGDEHLTFAELDAAANRFANHLRSVGIGSGDHIGVYGQNSVEWIVAALGAYKVSAVPININFRYVEDELLYIFDNADLVGLVHDRQYTPRVAAVMDKAPALRHFVAIEDGSGEDLSSVGSVPMDEALAAASPERPDVERSPDDRYMLYTGGTTGMPKGVVWRQEDVFFALGGGIDAYTNERITHDGQLAEKAAASPAGMVSLNTPPLMHGAAQWGALRFWFEGGTVVFLPKFSGEAVWSAIERERVNTVSITGDAMARPMVDALLAEPDRWDLSSLFVVSSTAAVLSPSVKDQFLELLPNVMVVEAIGSSEGGMNGLVAQAKGQVVEHKGGGPTVEPARDTIVFDEDLKPLEPGTGVIGRLARGGNIPLGYYKDEAKTAATFVTAPDGKRYVVGGDLAMLEADGTITLLGRGSGCINTGGEKVFPEEVEGVLKGHPAVYDALVVGVPDERWGNAVAAVVQVREGQDAPTLDEVAEHCRSHIAAYKVPRHLLLVPEIQRSPSGKPDYPWASRTAKTELGVS